MAYMPQKVHLGLGVALGPICPASGCDSVANGGHVLSVSDRFAVDVAPGPAPAAPSPVPIPADSGASGGGSSASSSLLPGISNGALVVGAVVLGLVLLPKLLGGK